MTLLVTRPRSQYPADALAGIGGDARGRLRAAAWLAQLAYEDDVAKVDCIAADWSLVRRLSLAPQAVGLPWQAETRLHVLEGSGLTIVSFCGTDPLRFANWVTDLRILPAAGGIHGGFLAALDAAWPQIEPWLRAARGLRALWVVGHSLGAALAALCALRATETLALKADRVFAFGMPRVGGAPFAERYEAQLGASTLRLVHGHDVVPRVPPSEVGYRHVGCVLACAGGARFDPARTATRRDDEPTTPRTLVDAAGLLLSLAAGPLSATLRDDPLGIASVLLPSVIADHLPDRYCAACEARGAEIGRESFGSVPNGEGTMADKRDRVGRPGGAEAALQAGVVTLTIPLHVTVTLGSPGAVPAVSPLAQGASREAASDAPAPPPRDAAALDEGPLTFRNHFLSLYQSIAEEVARRSAGTTESAASTPDGAVILAAERVARAYRAGAPVAPAALDATESLTTGEHVGLCASLGMRMLRAKLFGDAAALGRLQGEMEAGKCDPGWARTLEEYVRYFGPMGTRAKPLYVAPAKAGEAALPIKPGCRVGLIGDWGTGAEPARRLLRLVAAQKPDVLIHLGDIYYSGTPKECDEKFEAAMEATFGNKDRRIPIFTLAGNHDMYCGGVGYYDLIKRLNPDPLVQPASFFCLRSEDGAWQMLAMDTGQHDYSPLGVDDVVTFVEPEEAAWLKRRIDEFGGRTILLSHHQLFSAFARIGEPDEQGRTHAANLSLLAMLQGFGDARERIAAWFWGHEHNLCIYEPYLGLARGRCLGHSAVPVFVEDDPYEVLDTVRPPPTLVPDTSVSHDGRYYRHGFAMLTLNGDGTAGAEYFEDRDGTAVRTYAEVL